MRGNHLKYVRAEMHSEVFNEASTWLKVCYTIYRIIHRVRAEHNSQKADLYGVNAKRSEAL